ncbi:hypothetical protein LCGC14_1111280 [marine sediment metagenome]|uniref:Uncharacterized protein n=1 Tax=marine sediment metagenome TaxID=412755 RepID=A0A0F9MUI9_9ZZZZ
MASPTIAAITTYDHQKVGAYTTGAVRELWIGIRGLSAASDQDAGGNDHLYYLLNPFPQDMVIMNALAVITTLDAQDGDIDVGLANDAVGTSSAAEVIDSLVNTATGVFECTVAQAIAGTGAKGIWRKEGTSTDSYLTWKQATDADVSALQWHLFLQLIPYEDLIGGEGTQAAVTVA